MLRRRSRFLIESPPRASEGILGVIRHSPGEFWPVSGRKVFLEERAVADQNRNEALKLSRQISTLPRSGRRPFKPSAMGGRERRASLENPVKSALIKDLKVIKGVFNRIAQNARI